MIVYVTPSQFCWQNEGEPWELQEVEPAIDRGQKCVFRAPINHFSRGFLGKRLNLQCAFQTEKLWGSSKLEFLNATPKKLFFLVLPTSYTASAVTSIALGLKAQELSGELDVKRAVERGLLQSAFDFQVIPVPARLEAEWLREGAECPYSPCTLPAFAKNQARVALVTVDDTFVYVWFNKLINSGTEVVVLPRMFSDPQGYIMRRQLADGSNFDVVDAAGLDNPNSAVVAVGEGGASGGGN